MDTIIIYNPRKGGNIKDVFAQKVWEHKINTVIRYPKNLGEYLLGKYGFLVEVEPADLPKIKEMMAAQYECDFKGCDYITDSKKKLRMHKLGKHKLTEEVKKELGGIETASPSGDAEVLSKPKEMSPEQKEGIPDTKRGEKEGWYGPGWETDKVGSGMMTRKQPGVTPGHFE